MPAARASARMVAFSVKLQSPLRTRATAPAEHGCARLSVLAVCCGSHSGQQAGPDLPGFWGWPGGCRPQRGRSGAGHSWPRPGEAWPRTGPGPTRPAPCWPRLRAALPPGGPSPASAPQLGRKRDLTGRCASWRAHIGSWAVLRPRREQKAGHERQPAPGRTAHARPCLAMPARLSSPPQLQVQSPPACWVC